MEKFTTPEKHVKKPEMNRSFAAQLLALSLALLLVVPLLTITKDLPLEQAQSLAA